MRTVVGGLLGAACAVVLAAPSAWAADFGPPPPVNPYLGPAGTATMHGDAESSNTTPLAGPGTGPVNSSFHELGAACPTVLAGSDGMVQALCTQIVNRTPTVYLLDPNTGATLATLATGSSGGGVLGGVYAYVDNQDRMVTADGSGNLVWVAHDRGGPNGLWRLYVQQTVPTSSIIPAGDSFSSVTPDQNGLVWFATQHSKIGVVGPDGHIGSLQLPSGELVENSISSSPDGVAVATDHALYLLSADSSGNPQILWRQPYDRGPARKPGQLSWGTGATPAFFGPKTGYDYVTITDNAVPQEHLLVYNARTGQQICAQAVLPPGPSGTENGPIGVGNTVVVASTYGYPYPAGTVGPSQPASAPFTGGMTRVDVDAAGTGCAVVWNNTVPSSAVPRLSLADGKIYTFTRHTVLPGGITSPADTYDYAVVDAGTGQLDTEQLVGATSVFDTLQMVGTITPGQVQYQGTISGFMRINPKG